MLHEHFVIRIPKGMPLELAGPVMCGGITVYAPMKHHGATKGGMRVAVMGIGGLGTMAIKIAKALGNEVIAISSSAHKRQMSLDKGADHFLLSSDSEECNKYLNSIDLILDTVSVNHDLIVPVSLLGMDGKLVMLGLIGDESPIIPLKLLGKRKSVTGSQVGSIEETEEVLELCHKHKIYPDVKIEDASNLDAI